MKRFTTMTRLIAGASMAAALGIAGPTLASAEETYENEVFTGPAYTEPEQKGKAKTKAKGTASPEDICEAQERSKARTAKLIAESIPEQFGSEEPFTFSASVC